MVVHAVEVVDNGESSQSQDASDAEIKQNHHDHCVRMSQTPLAKTLSMLKDSIGCGSYFSSLWRISFILSRGTTRSRLLQYCTYSVVSTRTDSS